MKWLDLIVRRSTHIPVRVTIDLDSIVVQLDNGLQARHATSAATFERDLVQALQPTQGKRIAVTFDASTAHFDLLRWNAALTSAKRWMQFASARLLNACAGNPSHWSIRVLTNLPPGGALSAALPASYLAALKKVAPAAGIRVGLLDRINALLERDPMFSGCAVDVAGDRAWIFVLRSGAIERVRLRRMRSTESIGGEQTESVTLLPILASEWASTGDVRELPAIALAGSHAASAAVAFHDTFTGEILALTHRQPRGRFNVDFARQRAPIPAGGWVMAAVGLIAMCGAVAWSIPDWQKREQLAGAQHRLRVALADANPAPTVQQTRRADNATASGARSRDGQSEALSLTRELRKPWGALFGALESSSSDRVRIVQLDVDSRFRQVQIQAEAKSLSDLIRYGEKLASVAPINSARLAHHEWKAAGGGRVVSARLVATLDSNAARAAAVVPATARSNDDQRLPEVASRE